MEKQTEVVLCKFCAQMNKTSPQIFLKSLSGLFLARWDYQPDTPGHALVIPIRHVVKFHELTPNELMALGPFVEEVKDCIAGINLVEMYNSVFATYENDLSRNRVETVLQVLQNVGKTGEPDAFNDAINDGQAAGQTIHHLHWHIKPRWFGDGLPSDE